MIAINHHLEASPNFLPPLHHACGLKEAMLACVFWLAYAVFKEVKPYAITT